MEDLSGSKRLINPVDSSGEILFGLIMALSFTCSISIANSETTEVRQLLIGALSCNLAWGIIDATMYLISVMVKRNRNKIIFDHVHSSTEPEKAKRYIAGALPPIIASVIEPRALEDIRIKIKELPAETGRKKLIADDFKKASLLFLLVFTSTFPVVIPFLLITDPLLALRVSNLVALAMMFWCGWSVAKYSGINKWRMSLGLVLVGTFLVVLTISLGG